MTTITLTTVGYSEVVPIEGMPARLFTTLLLLGGVGSFVYFCSTGTAFILEGSLQRILWSRRMKNNIEAMSGHTIVCGGGPTGMHILRELLATGRDFVLVELDPDRLAQLVELLGHEFPAVLGDASDDEILQQAGIDRAAGLAACVRSDKDNMIVTVSARLLNPDLRVICRCIDERIRDKLLKAGADSVICPSQIGGLRMVSEMVRPTAVTFLDQMLRERRHSLRVESADVGKASALVGKTVGAVRAGDAQGLLVVALHRKGEWMFNPADDEVLTVGDSVVYMAGTEARLQLERLAAEQAG